MGYITVADMPIFVLLEVVIELRTLTEVATNREKDMYLMRVQGYLRSSDLYAIPISG